MKTDRIQGIIINDNESNDAHRKANSQALVKKVQVLARRLQASLKTNKAAHGQKAQSVNNDTAKLLTNDLAERLGLRR